MTLSVDTWQTVDTPRGNPAHWVAVSGPASEYRRAGRVAGAAARKIAKSYGPVTHAHRITSGYTGSAGGATFEERTLYAFDNAEID